MFLPYKKNLVFPIYPDCEVQITKSGLSNLLALPQVCAPHSFTSCSSPVKSSSPIEPSFIIPQMVALQPHFLSPPAILFSMLEIKFPNTLASAL
jgi:hypothetical protein